MTRAPATAHDRAAVLAKGRRIAHELVAICSDPASPLCVADRRELAKQAFAIDLAMSRMAGVEPLTAEIRAQFADALARIEAATG